MEDKKTNRALVNVVLDRSGSMNVTRAETISGYNTYIDGLRADKDTQYEITLIQFDAPNETPELTIKYQERPLADVPTLTEADYVPRGWTPLYDAIGECVRRVDTKDRTVLTVIITDGMENASREFTKESIKALLAEKEKEHWSFVFLGANIDSYSVGGSMGMSFDNTSNYAQGKEDLVYKNLASSTMQRSHLAGSAGMQAAASMRFFDDIQRAQMGDTSGGRPAAPPTFPQPEPKPAQRPVSRPRRNWNTNQ